VALSEVTLAREKVPYLPFLARRVFRILRRLCRFALAHLAIVIQPVFSEFPENAESNSAKELSREVSTTTYRQLMSETILWLSLVVFSEVGADEAAEFVGCSPIIH